MHCAKISWLVLLVIGLSIVLLCSGCPSKSGSAGKTKTLTVAVGGWMLTEFPELIDMAKEFSQRHPGYTIEYQKTDLATAPFMLQFRQKRTDYDVILGNPTGLDPFAASRINALVKMPDKIDNTVWGNLLDSANAESKRYPGRTTLPYLAEVMVLIYNKSLLSKAGISKPATTWEELEAQAKIIKVKFPDKTPVAVRLEDYSTVYWLRPTLIGLRGTMSDSEGWPLTNDPGVQTSLAMLQRWEKNGYCNGLGVKDIDLFRSSDAAYDITWASRRSWAATELGEKNIGVAPLPGGRAFVSYHFAVVPVYGKDVDMSCKFVTEVMLSDRMGKAFMRMGKMPARKDFYVADKAPAWILALKPALEKGDIGPDAPYGMAALDLALDKEVQAVASGTKAPEKAMADMQAAKEKYKKIALEE